jgi:hypothetical protein
VQQQIASTTTFEIAYVGSVSRHLPGEEDLNMPTLGIREANPGSPVNNIRPYLGYSDFHTRLPIYTANYNSMQISLNHRTARDLTLGIAYTWSKNLSNQSNDRGTASTYTYNPNLDYGPSELNQPQIFIANFVYKEPFFREQQGLTGHVLGGWEISGITSFNSGLSTTVTQASDPFACTPDANNPAGACAAGSTPGTYPGGLGIFTPNADIVPRADQVARVSLPKTQAQWFTTSSFATAQGHFGTAPVGSFLSPGTERIDLGLLKNFAISERINLQMRAEAFNLFNHTNFGASGGGVGENGIDVGIADTTFGQATSARLPRTMQFSGKLYF